MMFFVYLGCIVCALNVLALIGECMFTKVQKPQREIRRHAGMTDADIRAMQVNQ